METQKHIKHLTVAKVGGAVVEDDTQLTRLVNDFTHIEGPKLLVHGGGRSATKMAERLGVETVMVEGRRVTNSEMLSVATMVYGGLVNKGIVAKMNACGMNAIGLTGADASIVRAHRRPVVTLPTGQVVDYGFVGDVEQVNALMLNRLIEAGLVPVLAPLSFDGQGLLNTNADTIAQETATALAAHYSVTLIYAFEKPGVLARADDDSSVIGRITPSDFYRLKADGTISGGMVPKIANAIAAVKAGVERVIITSAQAIDGQHGTEIVLR